MWYSENEPGYASILSGRATRQRNLGRAMSSMVADTAVLYLQWLGLSAGSVVDVYPAATVVFGSAVAWYLT
jgi:hypothetical protein